MNKLTSLIKLFRINQYTKQFFVLLPIIALGAKLSIENIVSIFIAVISFSLLASVIYILNDLTDKHTDQNHHFKKYRPIASGQITSKEAFLWILILLYSVTFLNRFSTLPYSTMLISSIYLFLNILYSIFKLKQKKILGVFIVSLGFPIRFVFGTAWLGLPLSMWAFILIFQMSLFLLCGKRYQNLDRKGDAFENDAQFWMLFLIMSGASFISTYVGFISNLEIQNTWGFPTLSISLLLIIAGLGRYLELAILSKSTLGDDLTNIIVKDKFVLILGSLFVLEMFIGRLIK